MNSERKVGPLPGESNVEESGGEKHGRGENKTL